MYFTLFFFLFVIIALVQNIHINYRHFPIEWEISCLGIQFYALKKENGFQYSFFFLQWRLKNLVHKAKKRKPTSTNLRINSSFKKSNETQNENLPPHNEKKTSPSKKTTFIENFALLKFIIALEIPQDITQRTLRFFIYFLNALRVKQIHCEIGLKDFYRQGVLNGMLLALPYNKQIQIEGNFEERNSCYFVMSCRLGKFFFALLLFILRLPWINIIRVVIRHKNRRKKK